VALTTANRKLLWARSGGFCAICKGLLTEDATDLDPAVVTGMEAHIVSDKPDGPRYRPLEPDQVDDPENLILLCPTHHAIVDKQDSHYTEDQLRRIKREHEQWARQLGSHTPQVRIRDPHAGKPTILHRLATGAQLMGVAGGSAAMQTSQPDRLITEEVDLLASFLQDVSDWSDLWAELGPGERLRAEHKVTQELDELLEAGFVVYAGTRPQVIEGGVGPPMGWRLVVLLIVRAGNGDTADVLSPE
jgi:hypothetical protein